MEEKDRIFIEKLNEKQEKYKDMLNDAVSLDFNKEELFDLISKVNETRNKIDLFTKRFKSFLTNRNGQSVISVYVHNNPTAHSDFLKDSRFASIDSPGDYDSAELYSYDMNGFDEFMELIEKCLYAELENRLSSLKKCKGKVNEIINKWN